MGNRIIFFFLLWMPFVMQADEAVEEEKLRQKHFEEDAAYEQYIGLVGEIMNAFGDQMERELNLHRVGHGGVMHKTIEEIYMKFIAYRRATIEEARALQLYAMNRLLTIINSNEKIQPYLLESPFTYKRVAISICFEGTNGPNSDGSVEHLFNVSEDAMEENRNKIFYLSSDPFTEKSQEILSEHYEEAVKREKASALEFPFSHKPTDLEIALDKSLNPFTNLMKAHRLTCWGIGGKKDNRVEDIRAKYSTILYASKENARNTAVFVAEKLLEYINGNKELKPFLKEDPFPSSLIKLRIEFTDSRHFPYYDGSVQTVVLEDNTLTYYHQIKVPDEGPEEHWDTPVVVLAKESYPEALKIVNKMPPPSTVSWILKIPKTIYHWFF